MWARMLARLGDTWVITRENNREAIERGIENVPESDHLRFIYVDLPHWASFWKREQRGVRLYYILWLCLGYRRARRLINEIDFDLVWHLTFASIWLGSTGWMLKKPFIFGPVGGGERVPLRLASILGWKGFASELGRHVVSHIFKWLNPLCRASLKRSSLILTQNRETLEWLPRIFRKKSIVFPNTVLDEVKEETGGTKTSPSNTAIYAGRLLPWKGTALAVEAISNTTDWTLSIFGAGPDLSRLRELAAARGIGDRVRFEGWVPRDALRDRLSNGDLFLFLSLREGAGWAVMEALSAGLPVICFDSGGPPSIAGDACIRISPRLSRKKTVEKIVDALRVEDLPNRERATSRSRKFLLERRSEDLIEILKSRKVAG